MKKRTVILFATTMGLVLKSSVGATVIMSELLAKLVRMFVILKIIFNFAFFQLLLAIIFAIPEGRAPPTQHVIVIADGLEQTALVV